MAFPRCVRRAIRGRAQSPYYFPFFQVYETLVGRKIAKMKKAVRMKNNTW
jgi:hypothetical protein